MKSFVIIASWTLTSVLLEAPIMCAIGLTAFYAWFIYQTVVTHK